MRRQVVGPLGLLLIAATLSAAGGPQIVLVARDHEENKLPGFIFAYGAAESKATTQSGVTHLDLPSDLRPSQSIKIRLVPSAKQAEEEWFLVNSQVVIPAPGNPAEVVLMRQSAIRQIATEALDASRQAAPGADELTAEERKRVLVEAAARYGLKAEQLETALQSFAETQNLETKGIAAYLEDEEEASETRILLVARDLEERPLSGLRFACQGKESLLTDRTGATELTLKGEHPPGQSIKLSVSGARQATDWFLVHPLVIIPKPNDRAEVVLMRRSAFRQIVAEVRDVEQQAASSGPGKQLTAEERKRVVVEVAVRHHLTAQQLKTALRSFAEVPDPWDRGIAAYLEGGFSHAAELLNKATEEKTSALAQTLYYLGISQYQQEKYRAAVNTFQEAVALRGEDPILLSWLARAFRRLADWTEAERLLRRALAIDEKSFGLGHPDVARDLNNLASLLKETNRLAEAEPLMRRALVILLEVEHYTGHEHPNRETVSGNYRALLQKMGKTDAEIEAIIEGLTGSAQ